MNLDEVLVIPAIRVLLLLVLLPSILAVCCLVQYKPVIKWKQALKWTAIVLVTICNLLLLCLLG